MKTWHPPESPWRIDFPEDLPRRLHRGTAGLLYGHIDGSTIRIAPPPPEGDPVGIYISRRRGEVFLTDSDIARFEESGAAAALVMAGQKAGFFVRSSDGFLQSIRSFEEFSVPRARSKGVRIVARYKGIFAGALILLTILPVAGIAYLRRSVPSAGLRVRENGDQLLISWRPGRPGVLEISDSGQITSVRFPADRCVATYIRRGGDVRVKLTLVSPPHRQMSPIR
ncbi:MAG TPA: hypothetical protein VIY49_22300 [Bryobacteraceae bacterium]